ncbi:MAG TPA: SpoIIIAH-like family protein [Candidatus Copromorpha excrementigallinarum]|uniref:SpoIIIAH-like family protein n=1 Tax=Candidatus Allocopromorpha excrementigallinarum TaxID=2840742 RepID=A0A9D1L781_9FIRM|nr:SpoIIIAH-like family protein [Candidatus Copromorpha excrementigallinarum]
MSGKRSFFTFLKNNKKKMTVLALLAVCAGGYIGAAGSGDEAVENDIPLHDGDVLVDSLNVSEEEGKKGSPDESELVTSDDVAELENSDTYFQELRATLDMDRNKIISMLTDSESSSSGRSEKEEAAAEKMRLLGYMEQEKTVETLIKNKGLPEAFVVITESGVNVTVNTDELDQSMVTKICDIVMRETGRKASEIVIQDVS